MQEKFFLPTTLVICIIIFIGWQQFFYAPTQREILNAKLETRRLREVEREVLELKARHENLSAFLATKELELDEMRNFLPTTLAQDKFIDELYRAAESSQAQIISVQAGEPIAAEKLQEQIVTVNLEADYVSLLNFIREILDGERLASLENFYAGSSEGRILSCEVTFKIFAATP